MGIGIPFIIMKAEGKDKIGAREILPQAVTLDTDHTFLTLPALNSKAWIGYTDGNTKGFTMTPLDYAELDYGGSFSSGECEEGMVGIEGNCLR